MKFKKYALIIVFLGAIASLLSCSTKRSHELFTSPTDIITDTITQVHVVNDQTNANLYTIKEQDRIIIKNLQNRDFLVNSVNANSNLGATQNSADQLQTFEVDSNGQINIPKYGKVTVKGLTRIQAKEKIQKLFEVDLVNPIIDLSIINLKVTLLGEFKTQGNFMLEQENLTLIDIIAQAGGLTENADLKSCKIIRGDRSNPEIIYVNLNDIRSLASKKLVLQNNDLILIQQLPVVVASKRFQNANTFLQPVLVLLNLGLLILTIAK